ncbi:MAG: phosphoribosylformylglycinamidine synthase subunit PurL [Saprospiraceae bacterium]
MQQELAHNINLSTEDLQRIEKWMGRKPSLTEQVFFAYQNKESTQLRKAIFLPNKYKKIVEYRGQSLLDIDESSLCYIHARAHTSTNTLVAFESAATIADTYRAQLALGSRPLASWQALGFGDLQRFSTQQTINKTLGGLSQVNHQMGIPSFGGTLSFHDSFNQNVVANVFSIGILDKKSIKAKPVIPKNASIILISPFSVEETGWPKNTFLPNPLAEKQLMDAVLEIQQLAEFTSMYTLTDGGLAGALVHCCQEHNTGVELDLGHFENESTYADGLQAQFPASMLMVIDEQIRARIAAIANKQELYLLDLGSVQEDSTISIAFNDAFISTVKLADLAKFKPQLAWIEDTKKPGNRDRKPRFNFKKSASSKSFAKTAKRILKDPNTFDQQWLKNQLDATVQMNNLGLNSPSAASLIRVKGSEKVLAFSCDVNPQYTQVDPYYGSLLAVAEAARNIIISGATPVATVATMNFGDPADKLVAWQIQQSLKGIQEATHKFKTPLLEIDWSLGHEGITKNGAKPIAPMPVIGMFGLMPDNAVFTGLGFKEDGHLIYMIGTPHNDINASVYLKILQYDAATPTPVFDLDEEQHIQQHLRKLIQREMIASAHDIMEGGLFVALLESAAVNGYGFSIETDTNFRKDAYLFGEHQSRVIISLRPEREDDLVNYLNAQNVPFTRLGEVTGDQVLIDGDNYGALDQWVAMRTQGMKIAMK